MRRTNLVLTAFVLFVVSELPVGAQYPPGQYPPGGYPPGQYPPGQYPPDRYPQTSPIPRRGKKGDAGKNTGNLPLTKQITGVLRQIDDKSVLITADDSRNINLKRTGSTKFLKKAEDSKKAEEAKPTGELKVGEEPKKGEELKPELLKPGDHVNVEATEDDEGYFTAVSVTLDKEGTTQERAKASEVFRMPAPSVRSDDDERPKLSRKDDKAKEAKRAEEPAKDAPAPSVADGRSAAAAAAAPTEIPEAERANVPVVESDVPIDETDPGAPRLKRGRPTTRKPAQPAKEVAMNAPPKVVGRAEAASTEPVVGSAPTAVVESTPKPAVDAAPRTDPRITKTREAVAAFTQSLPAYVCQEQIARFVSTSMKVNWQPVDIVSAEVVYENGKEQYRNLAINGKAVKKAMEELSGAWSTGEFGTLLLDLFSSATDADFRYRRQAKVAGRDAYLFAFEVDRENSHWHIQVASQSILPAYRGSVWIDKETSQVLRVEMEGVKLPTEFPMDKIEASTDYQFIRLGERQYLLPVHAEMLSCQRGTNNCSRNAIDFRNYHKYSGEATITFDNK